MKGTGVSSWSANMSNSYEPASQTLKCASGMRSAALRSDTNSAASTRSALMSLTSSALHKSSSSNWMAASMVSPKMRPKTQNAQPGSKREDTKSSAFGIMTSSKIWLAFSSTSRRNLKPATERPTHLSPEGEGRRFLVEEMVETQPTHLSPGGGGRRTAKNWPSFGWGGASPSTSRSTNDSPLSQPSPSRGEGLEDRTE